MGRRRQLLSERRGCDCGQRRSGGAELRAGAAACLPERTSPKLEPEVCCKVLVCWCHGGKVERLQLHLLAQQVARCHHPHQRLLQSCVEERKKISSVVVCLFVCDCSEADAELPRRQGSDAIRQASARSRQGAAQQAGRSAAGRAGATGGCGAPESRRLCATGAILSPYTSLQNRSPVAPSPAAAR